MYKTSPLTSWLRAGYDPVCVCFCFSQAEWDKVMAVNSKGYFMGCKRAVQQMLLQESQQHEDGLRGRIINISSQHGMIACPGDLSYGVGKAAAVYMTRQIASDYAKKNITCNAVAPGKIVTGLFCRFPPSHRNT